MKYQVKPSETRPNSWVLTDTENLIVICWAQGKFNDTQEVTPLDDDALLKLSPTAIASILREAAEWLRKHHYDKLF